MADASHELRTPISVAQASAEFLLRHPQTPIGDERELIEGIVEETNRMSVLVRDLLDLGTHESFEPCDLSRLTEEATDTMQDAAHRTDVRLRCSVEPGVTVDGDRTALGQVVRALVDNAIKYSGSGSAVEVEVRRVGDSAILSVADDGPGIPPEDQERVFDRFARLDKARSRALGGSGLGLAIARAIVERHDGRIDVAPGSPHGAVFTVRLRALAEE